MKTVNFVVHSARVCALASMIALAGCKSSSGTAAPVEEGVVHAVSQADIAATRSTEPIAADSVTLLVNGLGCPQCASNIDKALENVKGVQSVQVDLSNGKVLVGLVGRQRPSAHRLSEAVTDAGLTLVKIIQ